MHFFLKIGWTARSPGESVWSGTSSWDSSPSSSWDEDDEDDDYSYGDVRLGEYEDVDDQGGTGWKRKKKKKK